jgi:ubiquinone/menaquinone biosynthesis C-methylase UbiE
MAMANPVYALGHTDRELQRLSAQARMIGPATRRFFREAGVAKGMRVLDVGSGAGDTAFLVADLVGEAGAVIGTDKVAAAVVAATQRAKLEGVRNVSFREGDPTELTFDRQFDAVVGRYVLLFQADPAAMLRKLAGLVRSGGVIAFHEPGWESTCSSPPAQTYDSCRHWIGEVLRLSGTPDTNMAPRLYQAFAGAGLKAPSMRMETFVGGGEECFDWLRAVAELVGSLLPAIERTGLATAAEVGLETLAERMRREVIANGSTIIGRSEIGVWSHV